MSLTLPAGDTAGLPFAGIPTELVAGVERVTADEPTCEHEDVPFSHADPDRRPLNIRRIIAGEGLAIVLATGVIAVEALSLLAGPLLTQIGIDEGITPGNMTVVVAVAAVYFVLIVLTAILGGVRTVWIGRIGQRVLYRLRLRVFAQQQRLSLDFFSREKAGVTLTRMTSDIESLNQLFQEGFAQLALQGLTVVIVVVVLFFMNAALAAITLLLVLPPLTVLSIWYRSAADRTYIAARDGLALVLSDLAESLSGIRAVAASNRQRTNLTHHRDIVGEYRDRNYRTGRVNSTYSSTTEMLGSLGQAAILLIGGSMVLRGNLSVGELTAFVLYLTVLFAPIQGLVQFYNLYQQGKAATTKLREFLVLEPTIRELPAAKPLPPVEGEISFSNVTFGYDRTQPILTGVDLTIYAGETFSLVGETGAGKSTIAKLVNRLYDPTEGRVLIDGHDIRSVTLESLRRQVGVVPQEPFLFVGTLRENIAFGDPDASDEDVMEAVRSVGLGDLVARLPRGLETNVHERGSSLSAGERQLLALARAFIVQPRVIILDEATSNLDLESESMVERALDVVLNGRTSIIIAHRLSTAQRADRIAVVADGRIAELGTPNELLAIGGRYASMVGTWKSHVHREAGES